MTVHEDVDMSEIRKLTPEEIDRREREYLEKINNLPLPKRIWAKTKYVGGKYDPLPAYDGCHVDKHGEPMPEIGIFGMFIMTGALPYYAVKESIVSLSNRHKGKDYVRRDS
jgi:hypothetical protein